MNRYRFICLLLSSLLVGTAWAQEAKPNAKQEKAPLFCGVGVSVDMLGFILKAASSSADMEIAARINLREKYFPVVEAGIGTCHRAGADNDNVYRSTAPFFRVGMDYNVNTKRNGNRLFGGARFGFTSFNFDFTNTGFYDPVWHADRPLEVLDHRSTCEWLDLVVGLETKLWRFIRLGYSLRYRFLINLSGTEFGEPYYIPGFGRNGAAFGGKVNLTFELDETLWKRKKKQ